MAMLTKQIIETSLEQIRKYREPPDICVRTGIDAYDCPCNLCKAFRIVMGVPEPNADADDVREE